MQTANLTSYKVRQEEEKNLSEYKRWSESQKRAHESVIAQAHSSVREEKFEDQYRSSVTGQARKMSSASKVTLQLLQSLSNKPYIGRIDTVSDGEEESFFFSDNEALEGLTEIAEGKKLIPFKQDDEKSFINTLMLRYMEGNTTGFKDGAYFYDISVLRKINIDKGVLKDVNAIYPYVETEDSISADDLPDQKLRENRQSTELRNIISTIQAQQFRVISTPVDQSFVLQGSAGSGKTQVLIHRLFYLRDALGKKGWSDVLMIMPTKLFQRYSADLIRRYNLADVKQMSIATFYRATLEAYDNRFRNRQYDYELTEEYLPDAYLKKVYSEENLTTIRTAIREELTKHIRAGCTLTDVPFPADGDYYLAIRDIVEKLNRAITELDEAERRAVQNEEYIKRRAEIDALQKALAAHEKRQERLRRESEKHRAELAAFEKLSAELAHAQSERDAVRKAQSDALREKETLLSLWERNFNLAETDAARLAALAEYAAADAWIKSARSEGGVQNSKRADELWLYSEICNECDLKITALCGKTPAQRWKAEKTQRITDIETEVQKILDEIAEGEVALQDHRLWIDKSSGALGITVSLGDARNKRAEMEAARYFLTRPESTLFEQEVWRTLLPFKEAHGISAVRTDSAGGQTQQTRILYKSDLLFYLMIYYEIYGTRGLATYRLLCIDEGQDLHRADYDMLKLLCPGATFNVFGDTAQTLHEGCGIGRWKDETGIAQVFEMKENYRSAGAVVAFCNKRFGCEMRGFGGGASSVDVVPRGDRSSLKNRLTKPAKDTSIIVRDRAAFEGILSSLDLDPARYAFLDTNAEEAPDNKIHVYSIFAAKGLEFPSVIVVSDFMNRNQKIVACTRAMDRLTYIESEQDVTA